VSTTFERSDNSPLHAGVDASSTPVDTSPFTENLLRSVLGLEDDQQIELVQALAEGKIQKGKFKTLAESYRARNEMKAYALTQLGELGCTGIYPVDSNGTENASRHKNTEQKLREARTWKYIESEKSKLIQESQGPIGKELGSQSTINALKQTSRENTKPLGSPGTQGVVPKTSSTAKKQRSPRADDRIAAKVEVGSRQTLKRGDKAIDAIVAMVSIQ
jgi:hypothetical protein